MLLDLETSTAISVASFIAQGPWSIFTRVLEVDKTAVLEINDALMVTVACLNCVHYIQSYHFVGFRAALAAEFIP